MKHPVEERVLRGEKAYPSAAYPGKGGRTVRWRRVEGGAKLGVTSEHLVDLAELLGREGTEHTEEDATRRSRCPLRSL